MRILIICHEKKKTSQYPTQYVIQEFYKSHTHLIDQLLCLCWSVTSTATAMIMLPL